MISEAGTHPNVGHLVVVAGFALDEGETTMVNAAADDPVASAAPPSALTAALRVEGDRISVDPEGARRAFYADCPTQPVERLRPMSLATFSVPVTVAAWKTVPSTYVLCTRDEAAHPDLQRFVAGRCTHVVELESSHSPMLSMPDRLAEIITAASA